jgi:hypothetical protein
MGLKSYRLVWAIVLLCGSCGPAFAYIDPGTGSMMLQGVIGAVAGALVVGRLYWSKIVGLVSGRSRQLPGGDPKDTE